MATGNYIVANGSSCCFSIRIQGWFCRNMESSETASRDLQTPNLLRNVSKCYAWQVVSLINEQQSQNLLLKVVSLSTIRTQGKQLETSAKLRVFVSNVLSLPLKRRYTRYGFLFLVFRHF